MSFLPTSTVLATSGQESPTVTGAHKFVIYYGWYYNQDGRLGHDIDRIIEAKPEFIISPYYTSAGEVNLRPKVMEKFHDNGIKVLTYVATGDTDRNLMNVLAEIKAGFDSGADGIMVDEVSILHTQFELNYYKKIYDYVKSFGSDKIVVANPGSVLVSEEVMSISDIVSFEHQWRLAPSIDWFSKYPSTRFMGVSSNDIENVMGYAVSENNAVADTMDAWQAGIGYHFSTDSYTELPAWFGDYESKLDSYNYSGSKLDHLKVDTIDSEGKEIKGLWIEVKKNDKVLLTGFSPTTFLLQDGTYQVAASNYQNFIFDRWQDGQTTNYQNIKLAASTQITAIYKNELVDLGVESFDNFGNTINGMHVTILNNGNTIDEGFTPLYTRLPPGQYTIIASSYNYYEFEKWEDNSNMISRQLNLMTNTDVEAYYNNTLANTVGKEIFSCQNEVQYNQQVANSILAGGPITALLELEMKKSIMASAGCISSQ